VEKASAAVRVGDLMTLPHLGGVIVIKVLGLGVRRGPAAEAMTLYEIVEDGRRDG
jgi:ribosome-associated heat shock protein Hsp15